MYNMQVCVGKTRFAQLTSLEKVQYIRFSQMRLILCFCYSRIVCGVGVLIPRLVLTLPEHPLKTGDLIVTCSKAWPLITIIINSLQHSTNQSGRNAHLKPKNSSRKT